jgi:hypothetical protein
VKTTEYNVQSTAYVFDLEMVAYTKIGCIAKILQG